MRILVVGSGGREHAIVWKLAQGAGANKIYCAPGNAGIAQLAECVDIKSDDVKALADFAKRKGVYLTIVGPESALCAGIADEFDRQGLRLFGPSQGAAEIEGSKAFAKELMRTYDIPTAEFGVFDSAEKAIEFINESKMGKVVVKVEGLAAGKGVIICETKSSAVAAVKKTMVEKVFGEAGNRIVIEEFLEGEEASYMVLTDGENIVPLASSQDHKRALDNDEGQNTGGMGAVSPAPIITPKLEKKILRDVMEPAVAAMRKEGREYKGVLYAGLMIDKKGNAKVLEFNARFGDPETQAMLPRLESGLIEAMDACIDGTLNKVRLKWKEDACTCVVMASGGYPEAYEKGKQINGLEEAVKMEGVAVFHAGTKKAEDGTIVTNGGRVLGVSALGDTIADSVKNAYSAVVKINFQNMQYRKDIGKKAADAEAGTVSAEVGEKSAEEEDDGEDAYFGTWEDDEEEGEAKEGEAAEEGGSEGGGGSPESEGDETADSEDTDEAGSGNEKADDETAVTDEGESAEPEEDEEK